MFKNGLTRKNFACKCGCGLNSVDIELDFVLEELIRWFNKPVTITSACRCENHNQDIGGVDNSYHKRCRAVDFIVEDIDPLDVYDYLDKLYPDRYGIGKYSKFTHLDTRTYKARW